MQGEIGEAGLQGVTLEAAAASLPTDRQVVDPPARGVIDEQLPGLGIEREILGQTRQQFDVAIQAAVGAQVIARSTVRLLFAKLTVCVLVFRIPTVRQQPLGTLTCADT